MNMEKNRLKLNSKYGSILKEFKNETVNRIIEKKRSEAMIEAEKEF